MNVFVCTICEVLDSIAIASQRIKRKSFALTQLFLFVLDLLTASASKRSYKPENLGIAYAERDLSAPPKGYCCWSCVGHTHLFQDSRVYQL